MSADRPHDVSGLTTGQLVRARRDLEVSPALAFPGSPCAGAQFPPIGELRRQHGHSRQTVTKAMGVLEGKGLICPGSLLPQMS